MLEVLIYSQTLSLLHAALTLAAQIHVSNVITIKHKCFLRTALMTFKQEEEFDKEFSHLLVPTRTYTNSIKVLHPPYSNHLDFAIELIPAAILFR